MGLPEGSISRTPCRERIIHIPFTSTLLQCAKEKVLFARLTSSGTGARGRPSLSRISPVFKNNNIEYMETTDTAREAESGTKIE